ncbi:MAG TPA: DEAD/DEAH box helicase [Bacillota bacterium]|nr:DEAD/DEAH box helicase [Bacillota bacterium]
MSNNFNDLGISQPILKAIEDMGFQTPTEVQSRVIPHIFNLEDLIVMSKTGSGKTAVFGIPLLQLTQPDVLQPEALILTPTRELAVQIDNDLKQMAAYLPHKTTAVYGQHSMNIEIQALKKGASIVVGTPGRVFDHIRQGNLKVKQIRWLILDEADRMLDMGFIDQVFKIIKTLPKNRITLLFSATMPPEIQSICRGYMKNPIRIAIESQTKTVDTIHQTYYRVNRNEKRTQLHRMLMLERPESCLIFCNTRYAVDQVQKFLESKGYASQAIHGDIPQGKRLTIMQQFKDGKIHILVATDVAARGIHIDDLALVINYDVPLEKDNYVHRIGRTGRAGKGGRAITFATGDDIMSLYEIEEHTGALIEEAELPADAEINAIKSDAELWIREKFKDSVLAPRTAPKDSQESQSKSPSKRKRSRSRGRGGYGQAAGEASIEASAEPRVSSASESRPGGETRSRDSSRPRPKTTDERRPRGPRESHPKTDDERRSRAAAESGRRSETPQKPRPETPRKPHGEAPREIPLVESKPVSKEPAKDSSFLRQMLRKMLKK